MKKKGFTLIELLVVVAIIAMLLAILMPALNKVKKIAQRVVCGTNLKGLGNAQVVYANDFDGQYACQNKGATAGITWTWTDNSPGWQNSAGLVGPGISIGSSLYLLVRLADVSPKSFVCSASDQQEFTGKNQSNYDIVELWDFGSPLWTTSVEGPAKCVSYAYHMPYNGTGGTGMAGRYRADDQRSAAFAMMADKNPWYDPKIPNVGNPPSAGQFIEYVRIIGTDWLPTNPADAAGLNERQRIQIGNAQPHEREGQNVLFADGHSAFEKRSDVGIKNDNIYTRQSTAAAPDNYRKGTRDGGRTNTVLPAGIEDSYLMNDDIGPGR